MQLCLNFANHIDIDADDKLMHINTVNEFVEKYNELPDNSFKLKPCVSGKKDAVILTIQNSRFVAPKEQALYVIISTLGIAYPLSGGGFGFVWVGASTTTLGVQMSEDLGKNPKAVYRQFSSSPYFYELSGVKRKHMQKFKVFLFELFEEIKNLRVAEMKNDIG